LHFLVTVDFSIISCCVHFVNLVKETNFVANFAVKDVAGSRQFFGDNAKIAGKMVSVVTGKIRPRAVLQITKHDARNS
jgi:hypothetical protein